MWSLETWPVSALAKFIRHRLDTAKVNSLVESLKEGNELPPIFVLSDGQKVTILDGHHRVAAWQASGTPSAPVIVARAR
jgi:ParB-like chromosome segregation protein Spo0J